MSSQNPWISGDDSYRHDHHGPSGEGEILWQAGSFSLRAVLGGYSPCPPGMRSLVFVAWRPVETGVATEADPKTDVAAPEPVISEGPSLTRARRASDRVVERPGAAREEATMSAAWATSLAMLSPAASKRLCAYELGFVTATDVTQECQDLFMALRRDHPAGDWRVGIALLEGISIMQAARALELWVLDGGDDGCWLVDVTELAVGPL